MRLALRTARPSRGARLLFATLVALCLTVPAMPAAATTGTGISSSTQDDLQKFALSLVNCTRGGGWVRPNGTCDVKPAPKYRSTHRKPLKLSDKISDEVARSLAIKCAKLGRCSHTLGKVYTARFREAGIKSHVGEALGYGWWGPAKKSIISSFRLMQAEKFKSYRWHWRYLKEKDFTRVGIAIAKRGSYTVIVYDYAA
jgi:hypothetical protein